MISALQLWEVQLLFEEEGHDDAGIISMCAKLWWLCRFLILLKGKDNLWLHSDRVKWGV